MTDWETVPDARRQRLGDLLDARGLDALWFARPNGFAWLTGGNNVVDRSAPIGTAAAGYDGESVRVLTTNIEADRLREEELPEDVVVESYDWYADSLVGAIAERTAGSAAADVPVPGFEEVDGSALRQPLTPGDVDRYRRLGRETTAAVEEVCRGIEPGKTERAVSASLRGELAGRGIEAHVSLVGGGERAQKHRHYTPQDARIGDYALVSVTAERAGLFVSCTRTVAFDAPAWLDDRHETATRIETTALAATRDVGERGGTAGDVFDAIRTAYAELGWDGEWKRHHQGGAAGFAGREWIASPGATEPVQLPMAYAWNPTVQGAKSEGTVLVTGDGYEPLTPGSWPTRAADAVGYGLRMERPDILGMART